MRTECGGSAQFPAKVGLHQVSALSQFLFVVVFDVFSENGGKYELWELLYATDLGRHTVIVTEKSGEIPGRNGEEGSQSKRK